MVKRGAGRADELTMLGISIADILRLGGTWPPAGAKRIQDPSARSATSTDKASSTSSAPSSIRSEKDLPTTFYAELDREDQSMKSNFFGQEARLLAERNERLVKAVDARYVRAHAKDHPAVKAIKAHRARKG